VIPAILRRISNTTALSVSELCHFLLLLSSMQLHKNRCGSLSCFSAWFKETDLYLFLGFQLLLGGVGKFRTNICFHGLIFIAEKAMNVCHCLQDFHSTDFIYQIHLHIKVKRRQNYLCNRP
jgi:hypothetical protein